MADKSIGELERAPQVNDDSLIPIEQQGKAMAMSGKQFADFGRNAAAAYVNTAVSAAADARVSAENAKTDADRAEIARESIVLDEHKMAQAVENAATSAENAAASEAVSVDAADRAQSYAEQASVPPVEGVYNIILVDRATAERYALIVESGRLKLLGVSDTLNATERTIVDSATGVAYSPHVENGRLILTEV